MKSVSSFVKPLEKVFFPVSSNTLVQNVTLYAEGVNVFPRLSAAERTRDKEGGGGEGGDLESENNEFHLLYTTHKSVVIPIQSD